MARIGIVYNEATGRPLSVIITDGALEEHIPLEGEKMLEIDESEYQPDEQGNPVNIADILARHGVTQVIAESEG